MRYTVDDQKEGNTMKRIRSIAVIIAVLMVISLIPMTIGAVDGNHPIVKDVINHNGYTSTSENYFALGRILFDKDGNRLWETPRDNEEIYTLTDGCVVTAWVDGETLGDVTFGFNIYSLKEGQIAFKSACEDYPYVSPYSGNDYTVVSHIDILKIKKEGITDYLNLSALPLYGYDIIDENGDIVYSEDGNKTAECLSDNIFIEKIGTENGAVQYNILKLNDSDAKRIPVDYECWKTTDLGNILIGKVIGKSRNFGVADFDGEILVPIDYTEISVSNGYYLAYKSSQRRTDVYDSEGNKVFDYYQKIQQYNGDFMVIQKSSSNGSYNYELIEVASDTVLAKRGKFCKDFVIGENPLPSGTGIVIYDLNGNVLMQDDDLQLGIFDESNGSFILKNYKNGSQFRLNTSLEVVEHFKSNLIVTYSNNNVSVVNDPSHPTDTGLRDCCLMYEGQVISDYHHATTRPFPTISGCNIYVFSSNDPEYAYTSYIIKNNSPHFSDVFEDNWAAPYITLCYESGIMNGTGNGKFSPLSEVSRAQVVTTLWRLAGEPAAEGENTFVDVADSTWYTDAVAWAAECGITTGVGGAYFAPDRTVTRGEVAAILYRYAEYAGDDVSVKADLSSFADKSELSDWNRDAFAWCAAGGIITGKTTGEFAPVRLAPSDALTRAEIAAILCRYGI